ncbi:hypothetical protein [Nitrosarchaeum sp. AC2]|uniref:hypothetical protein n=1 Tax=Nitrosarchaeum sp. AC2 TaxID=2259673 RepID=UPI0015C86667|nr:hypothetical protein [Nitrosarchaeum sp. AC2]QLH11258.1 hypothetical protein DSQ20_07140 [Nitrosarchaeum sp. AC2]
MGIRFATCARRNNDVIVGIGTVHKNSLGQDVHQYWSASQIHKVQDTEEISRYVDSTDNQEKTMNLGFYQFLVRSEDKTRSVEIRTEQHDDGFFILEPVMGDDDLVRELQECPGDFPASDE